MGRALAVLSRVRRALHQRKGVVSVGLGRPEVGGKRQASAPFAIIVGVKKKLPPESLTAVRRLPRFIGGVRIDVVEDDLHLAACLASAAERRTGNGVLAVRGGLAVGDGTTGVFLGTLAANLGDAQGRRYGLTALHVAKGHPGLRCPPPAGGNAGTSLLAAPKLDAAVVRWKPPGLPIASGAHGANGGWSEVPLPADDERLLVTGACSGETRCRIIEVDVSVPGAGLSGLLKVQTLAGDLFREGDSGGSLMTRDRTGLIGMFIAGNAAGSALRGYCVPIQRILAAAAREGLSLL